MNNSKNKLNSKISWVFKLMGNTTEISSSETDT